MVTVGIKVAGGLLSFSATVVVWVDGEGLLPSAAVCVLAGLRLGLKNCQVGEKWVYDDYSYLCKGLYIQVSKKLKKS
jgi:hypothetical protein